MDFPVFIKQALANGKIDTPVSKLICFYCRTIETVDDPSLLGLMFFVKPEDIGGASHVMDDKWLLVLLGKQDMLFKNLELKRDSVFVSPVDACFTDGYDTVLFEKGFKL